MTTPGCAAAVGAVEWRATPDGRLGVFASRALADGELVERCYCLPIALRELPGKQLLPWLFRRRKSSAASGSGSSVCGSGGASKEDDEVALLPLGWGLLYNNPPEDGAAPNIAWGHESRLDDNGVSRDYVHLSAAGPIDAGAELCLQRPESSTASSSSRRDALSAALAELEEAIAASAGGGSSSGGSGGDAPPELGGEQLSGALLRPLQGAEVRCSPLHGNGVYATRAFRKGDVIEVAPTMLLQRWELGQCLIDYRFAAPEVEPANSVVKVALGLGSVFNHSDEPNLAYRRARASPSAASKQGPEHWATCYYAQRDIAEGEELFISYGKDWWRSRKPEKVSLGDWRARRGETREGRPFYDAPMFPRLCEVFNGSRKKAELCPKWKLGGEEFAMSPALVEERHRAYVAAADGDTTALEAWASLCGLMQEALGVQGALNTPLRETGDRAVHHAAQCGFEQNLRWMVLRRVDMNAPTAPALELSPAGDMSTGLCPVHLAAACGHLGALSILAGAGVDLSTARVPDGATPLDFAEDAGQEAAVAWLQERGAVRGLS